MASGEKTNVVNEALGFPQTARLEIDLNQRMGGNEDEIVLAMADLDGFLAVNDRFGFGEGDRVLIETGRYLQRETEGAAAIYRYGGDQFALLFAPGIGREDAFLRMEGIRRGYRVALPDGGMQTLSIGIAAYPGDGSGYYELVRSADGAMMRGKTAGRNQICLAREEKMVTKTSHYTTDQLKRLTKISRREGIGEAVLLREALDALINKYDA